MERSEAERRFRALFDTHRRLVLGYALRRVDEPADAADVVAETFLVAWRRLGDVPEGDAARAWLLGVARRVLARLSQEDRELLLLAGWDGLTPREIAAATGTLAVTVRSRLSRARRRLRAELTALGWESDPATVSVATQETIA